MNEKLYISNMCQAGFLHKCTQKTPYPHPFLFCCFMSDDFVKFMENFESIDFNNYKKLHYNESKIYNHQDVYTWDGLNRQLGIKTENTPTIEFENGIQIIYPHVDYDAFDDKYKKRLKRLEDKESKEICFIFRIKNHMDKSVVDRFYNCNKYKKILLFDTNVSYLSRYKENEYNKIIVTNYEHAPLVKQLILKGIYK